MVTCEQTDEVVGSLSVMVEAEEEKKVNPAPHKGMREE